ncbi:hypothetical protein N0V87_005170 [Didymella glomerata]|uniref:Uncharacterized protein n=1 Tax=Didymella glomerata TaxID=749621 RepID=A0A9W9BZZ1_9PLEO|nr:hypothetical protein N0V87_005170 [Didymella glomerata]
MDVPQVGRAATAAPLYFKELKVRQKHGRKGQKYYFSDAGFGELNNPTGVGLQEIETLYPRQTIGAVLNVGTSRSKPDPTPRSVLHIVKKLAGNATDPNIVAKQVAARNLPHHWRFNDDRGIKIELDDWKPNSRFSKGASGSETCQKIRSSFEWWSGQPQNIQWLQECARELVTTRRGRSSDRSRWEQFAVGAHEYRCRHEGCQEESYNSRHQFQSHWENEHEGEAFGEDFEKPKFKRWVYQERPEGQGR